jgi:hypothetical protein
MGGRLGERFACSLGHDDGHDILALFFSFSDLSVYNLVYKGSGLDSY